MGETTLPTINLNSGAKTPKAYPLKEIIAAEFMHPITFFTKGPLKAVAKVRERKSSLTTSQDLQKINREIATKAVGSIATIAGLNAAGPKSLLSAAKFVAPKSPQGVVSTLGVSGLLISSKTARNYAGNFLRDPLRPGMEAGKLLDKAAAGGKIDIPTALKTGGLLGGGVALGAGAKSIYDKVTGKSKQLTIPTMPLPTGVSSFSSTSGGQMLESAPVIATTKTEPLPSQAPPSVVVNNNIKINNKSSANRRFINNVHI